MRSLSALAAIALLASVSGANAADITGIIKDIDTTKGMVVLDNGSSFMVRKSVDLSVFKIGEKVTVSFTGKGANMEATAIMPAT